MNYQKLATQVLEGHGVTDEEALAILNSPDEDLLLLLHATYSIRSHYFGNKVKLNMIINTKSGLCPENCGYCAQSIISKAPVEKYAMMKSEEILEGAERAAANKAGTYCIVASGRGPRESELDIVIDSVKQIKEKHKGMTVCACLGILKPGQATRLKEAGVDRYNHNLNTSAEHHESITTSHTYDDRVNTVGLAKEAGISPCSGVIVGMRETKQDIISMARSLRELDADSIPVNFLHAVDGTPLEGTSELDPRYCLKVLCLFRYINPSKEIRISGGREVNLRSLQPLGLYAANSIFIGDYLTTAGQENDQDQKMLEDMGFEVDLEPLRKEPITI
ncbi:MULTISPECIES: biotin synthase BioB [unclassified Sporosarcina]|uniref:biotin synthase BioB n=1 Tax=unclassified Sporosarcina TaxID=2647733 RepID=UPI000C16D8EB|nr:biotin synthase BioB [Sporosarcina sp. P30]PID09243.1 biotin synthase BioB [Sporosarcina sp. P31]PID12541.1 biotin synthase BioB [Sporosarcina sp. P32b]